MGTADRRSHFDTPVLIQLEVSRQKLVFKGIIYRGTDD